MADRNLRTRLIRLAHEQSDLRADLLPLLARTAAFGVGDSMENEGIRAHQYRSALQVWDLECLLLVASHQRRKPGILSGLWLD